MKSKSPMLFCYRVLCMSRIGGTTQEQAGCLQHLTELGNMSLEIYASPRGKATPVSTTPHAALYLLLLFTRDRDPNTCTSHLFF